MKGDKLKGDKELKGDKDKVTELLLTFGGVVMLMALMAIGILLGRKPIAGSCGGLAALSAGKKCSVCGATPLLGDKKLGDKKLGDKKLGDKNNQKLPAANAVCLGSEAN